MRTRVYAAAARAGPAMLVKPRAPVTRSPLPSAACSPSVQRHIFIHMGEYKALDDTLIALADPTRRAILARLSSGEVRVTDLAAPFSISLNSVSKHIRILERARLVRRRRAGREHLLRLNPKPLDAVARWMAEQRKLWGWRLRELDRILTEEERS
jgi:DNA-binding transcriptional ArsR family regulator